MALSRILIVGAGPTGLTAAVELARAGIEAEVIEARDGPSNLSRAVGILPGAMEVLGPSGVADAIRAEAVRFAGTVFHDHDRPIGVLPLNFDDRSQLWGLAQDRTEAHLRDALEQFGGQIYYGERFESLTQDAGGVTVETSRRSGQRYDLVIGADGAHSRVREVLGIPFDGFDLPNQWSIADVDADVTDRPDWFRAYLLDEGNVAIVVPLEAARFRVIASLPDALAALPVPMNVRMLRRSGAFTISIRQVPRYVEGRVALAGDAAHCHSPAGGRGMNLGIADAGDLAARIVTGSLDGYSAGRHAEGKRVIGISETGRRMLQTPSRRPLVKAMIRLAGAMPWLGRAAIRQMTSD